MGIKLKKIIRNPKILEDLKLPAISCNICGEEIVEMSEAKKN